MPWDNIVGRIRLGHPWAWAVVVLFVAVYLLPLGVRPVILPDETRYAEIPREMLVTGDWISPRLDGLRYFEKPVLAYWSVALSFKIFGNSAWAMRLPSALAAGGAALILFFLIRRMTDDPRWPALGAAAFLTCLEVFALGVFNVPDGLLAFFLTATVASFFAGSVQEHRGRTHFFWALSGAAMGLAFLTKGFLALAVPALTVLPFMIWEKKLGALIRSGWVLGLTFLLVVLPWSLMILFREPDFWPYFFWVEHIQRFLSDTPQHPEPFWYFLPIIMAGSLPWMVFLPGAVRGFKWEGPRQPLIRLALCWLFFPFLFFSASQGKLGTYILPCFPPLVLLLVAGLAGYVRFGGRQWIKVGAFFWSAVMGLAALALVLTQGTSWFPQMKIFGQEERVGWLVAAGGLAVWSLVSREAGKAGSPHQILALFALAPVLFLVSSPFLLPEYSRTDKAPGLFLTRMGPRVGPDTLLVSDRDLVTAVCWSFRRSNVFLLEKGGELEYGLGYPDSRERKLSLEEFSRLVQGSRVPAALVVSQGYYEKIRSKIPVPTELHQESGFTAALFRPLLADEAEKKKSEQREGQVGQPGGHDGGQQPGHAQ